MARSTYYYEIKPHGIDESEANGRLLRVIAKVHRNSKGRYGVRKVWGELRFRWGVAVNYKKVARMMRKLGLRGSMARRRRYSSYKGQIGEAAQNLIKRDFGAKAPNQFFGNVYGFLVYSMGAVFSRYTFLFQKALYLQFSKKNITFFAQNLYKMNTRRFQHEWWNPCVANSWIFVYIINIWRLTQVVKGTDF